MTTVISRQHFDKFVFHWCDYYGLAEETPRELHAAGVTTGEDLLTLSGDQITALPVSISQRCLLRGALLQYSISMQTVNKEIWKTILMALPSSGQTKAQAPTKKTKSEEAFRKMRHIFDLLDTFDVHHDISDTDQVMAQIAHQRELRRRLHKKRTCPTDNLTLAERILKQRQGPGSEIKPRSLSAPPMNVDLTKSATSLASVQSSPAAAYGTEQASRNPAPDSKVDTQKSNNQLDVPSPNTNLQQNKVDSDVGSKNIASEQTNVQVDVHAWNASPAIVSESDPLSSESPTSGEDTEKDAGKQESSVNETCLVSGDDNLAQQIKEENVTNKNTAIKNGTDETNKKEKTDGNHIKKSTGFKNIRQRAQSKHNMPSTPSVTHNKPQDKTQTSKTNIVATSKDSNNQGNTTPRASPSFLQSNEPRTGSGKAGNSPETIPLQNLSKDKNDGNETNETMCPLELVKKLEQELFTDEERALLAQYQKNKGNDKDTDALERIMTGEFDRDLKATLHT